MISNTYSRTRVSGAALAVALLWTPAAFAQTAPAQAGTDQTAPSDEGEIVVQGFRASLNSALNIKREETAAVDSIVAEDIGKFPDSNLAESMQRIPGVALARGDGGEGRNISVRGLGPGFTRVRINGMEGTAQAGGSDIQGPSNTGRSFDFNVFPTEIFSSLAVRKTASADVEEGSLGATVDLKAPKPMDYKKDFVLSATARGVYSTVAKKVDPRASIIVSKKLNDSWGVLLSGAYQKRHIREAGYAGVEHVSAAEYAGADVNPAFTPPNGAAATTFRLPFCTPLGGFTTGGITYQSPGNNATANGGLIGADANNCSAGNPRQSTQAAYKTVFDMRRADAPNVPGSGAYLPRMPRYVNSEQDTKRIGGTFTLQYKPDNATDISLDLLYSRFEVERRDNYLAAFAFARGANTADNSTDVGELGLPVVSVKEIQFNQNGSMVYGNFTGVNVRAENLRDRFTSEFKQGNLNFMHKFNDVLEINGTFGMSQSVFLGEERFQTAIDAPNRNFIFDARDGGAPKLTFDFDVANPANWTYGVRAAGGPPRGLFDPQGRPGAKNTTDNLTAEFNTVWDAAEGLKIKAGAQYRESEFKGRGVTSYVADRPVLNLPAGVTLASITRQTTGVDAIFDGAPASWTSVDTSKFQAAFNTQNIRFCNTPVCSAGFPRVKEEVKGAYAMATFNTEGLFPITLRGDVGVRYVRTDMISSGYISVSAPAQPTTVAGQYAQVIRGYDDWLPSANLVWDITPDLLLRLAASKVMARPPLGNLTPTSGVNVTPRTGNVNNPFLDPYRADTFDAALEWYFAPGSLLSVGYFKKNISSYIQSISSQVPYSELGLPTELLNGFPGVTTAEIFTVNRAQNTPGGPLEGVEVNAQVQLSFLPGFLSNLGVLANYTRVSANINYCLASAGGNCIRSTTAALVGLSKNTASGTLFYEDSVFSIRSTASFRDRYIRSIPGGFLGTDIQGNSPNLFVDASASLKLTDNIKLIVEGQNLTNEMNTLYNDSVRKDMLFQLNFGRTITGGVNFQF